MTDQPAPEDRPSEERGELGWSSIVGTNDAVTGSIEDVRTCRKKIARDDWQGRNDEAWTVGKNGVVSHLGT